MTVEPSILLRIQVDAFVRAMLSDISPLSLSILEELVTPKNAVELLGIDLEVTENSILVFADRSPESDWGHDCTYLLYKPATGVLSRDPIRRRFPPFLRTPKPPTYKPFLTPSKTGRMWADEHFPVAFPTSTGMYEPCSLNLRSTSSERYALLIAGDSEPRHVNDLEFLYRTLVDKYRFRTDRHQILVCNSNGPSVAGPLDGKTWAGDNTAFRMQVTHAGSVAGINAAFELLTRMVKGSDFVLIHTNNHGDFDSVSLDYCIDCINGEKYLMKTFVDRIAKLTEKRFRYLMMMMQQCRSGAFVKPVLKASKAARTSIATACAADGFSAPLGDDFDSFTAHWTAAMMGCYPSGSKLGCDPDLDGDGSVSAREAYRYAQKFTYWADTPRYRERNYVAPPEDFKVPRYPQFTRGVILALIDMWPKSIPQRWRLYTLMRTDFPRHSDPERLDPKTWVAELVAKSREN